MSFSQCKKRTGPLLGLILCLHKGHRSHKATLLPTGIETFYRWLTLAVSSRLWAASISRPIPAASRLLMLSPTQVLSRPNMQTVYNGNRFHGLIGRWIWLPYPLLTLPCRMLLKFRVQMGTSVSNMPLAILKLKRLNIINAHGSLHSHHWRRFITHQIFFQVGKVWR